MPKKKKNNQDFIDHIVDLVSQRSDLIDEGNWLLNVYKPQVEAIRKKYQDEKSK